MNPTRTVIIGAGISGLALGRLLPGAVIFEKSAHVGGASRTIHRDGFHFDVGLHALFRLEPEAEAFLKPWIGNSMARIPFRKENIIILRNGAKWPGILAPHDLSFRSHPALKLAAMSSYYFRQAFPLRQDSFEAFAKNFYGDWYYRFLVKPGAEKYAGLSGSEMHAPAVEVRKRPFSRRVLDRCLGKSAAPAPLGDVSYPLPWFGRIVEDLAGGLDIRTSCEITRVFREGRRVTGVEVNGRERVECGAFVSTVPGHALLGLFDAPEDVRKSAAAIRYRDLIYAVLFFDVPRITDGLVLHAVGDEIFLRAFEPKNWSRETAPEEKTSICFEIYCWRDEAVWRMTDGEIRERILADFRRYCDAPAPSGAAVFRIPNARLVGQPDLKDRLAPVSGFLSSYENAYFLRDELILNGLMVGPCILEAIRLSKIIGPSRV